MLGSVAFGISEAIFKTGTKGGILYFLLSITKSPPVTRILQKSNLFGSK